jgi:hypothetical protein
MSDPAERLPDMLEAIAAIERHLRRGKAAFEQDEFRLFPDSCLGTHCLRGSASVGTGHHQRGTFRAPSRHRSTAVERVSSLQAPAWEQGGTCGATARQPAAHSLKIDPVGEAACFLYGR